MQPEQEIRFHPVDLTRHGLTPSGQALYRVVWADSRRNKVMYQGKVHSLPRYKHQEELAGRWIVEKWQSPEKIMGMGRENWEAFLSTLPPMAVEEWPADGEYELELPLDGEVNETLLHHVLELHNYRLTNESSAERNEDAKIVEANKEKVEDAAFDALFEEAREESLKHAGIA